MANHTSKRKHEKGSQNPDNSPARFASIIAGHRPVDTMVRSDKTTSPPAKKAKIGSRSEESSKAPATLSEGNKKIKLVPALPEWGVYIMNLKLDFADVAGYLNLANGAQVVELWEICQEPLWCLLRHFKDLPSDTGDRCFKDLGFFFGHLDHAKTSGRSGCVGMFELQDITSKSLPDFYMMQYTSDDPGFPTLVMIARFIYQVITVVNEHRKTNAFPKPFSGAGTGREAEFVAKDLMRLITEDANRIFEMFKLYRHIVDSWPRNKEETGRFSLSAAKKLYGKVVAKPPNFGKGLEPGRALHNSLVSSDRPVNTSTKELPSHGVVGSTKSSVAHNAALPDDLERSVREMSVSANASTGPVDFQNAATTAQIHGQPSTMLTKQPSPNVINSAESAGMCDARDFLTTKPTQLNIISAPSEDTKLAAENAQLLREVQEMQTRLATVEKSTADTKAMDEEETRLLEQERTEVLKDRNARLKGKLAEVAETYKTKKAEMDARDDSIRNKRLERARLEKERLANI
ncbi:hypothetical protein LTR27_008364 [Elasticomyces elasticus]|nr:hypothetical protein LTR27_008364 [Elasticomyces elasticus]